MSVSVSVSVSVAWQSSYRVWGGEQLDNAGRVLCEVDLLWGLAKEPQHGKRSLLLHSVGRLAVVQAVWGRGGEEGKGGGREREREA